MSCATSWSSRRVQGPWSGPAGMAVGTKRLSSGPLCLVDVNPTGRDQGAELERLLKPGARPADIGRTGEEQWHVLADPEGNEFCLLKARLKAL